ncbi:integral membrane protein [Xylariales sp. AK1849]|nr:integral membrane protein [Xylariales sp. AK1849]
MGVGAFAEPLVVVTLLFGGVYVNRNTNYRLFASRGNHWKEKASYGRRGRSPDRLESPFSDFSTDSLLEHGTLSPQSEPTWRKREVGLWGTRFHVTSPNTEVFRENFLSRLLCKLPFLVECWYWALVYWVYQLGRAVSALTLDQKTVDVARHHALQVIELEKRLHIFWELPIQQALMRHETLMHWVNRIYSYIHIPGTIFFLVWLYYYTTVRNRVDERQASKDVGEVAGSPAGSALYQARRRTMAMCNLLAFIVFTAWPCMPPRLLSDPNATGQEADLGRTFGFHDTVHGKGGESSVWTQNKFCNQYAAMPSLHFGYSLMIGLTVAMVPLAPRHRRTLTLRLPGLGEFRLPAARRLVCLLAGFAYPFIILVAIVSTANHFILDAVAGACVCAAGWWGNRMLLNLLPVEDYFLWCLRLHKP